jgi:hypothetical protein
MKPLKKVVPAVSLAIFILACAPAYAGQADVIDVQVSESREGTFAFDVTVAHQDNGWEHYADKWDIVDEGGNILATRILHHPHVDEQPFTRSLSGVEIAPGINKVTVQAHDSVHGYGGRTLPVKIR